MRNIYRSLLMVIAGSTQKELARQIRYLKIENQILRSRLPARIMVTAQERNRLIRYAANLGRALNELATIVHPDTIRRWIRESKKGRRSPAKRGRRRTAEDIRRLVIKLAKENGWGYTRILGELRKLGIRSISRNTVKNILKENGYDPGPKRGLGTWDEFLKIHAATLRQCDFFSKKVLTTKGFRDLFVLVFLHVESRRVFVTPATYHPNESWMIDQAAAFLRYAEQSGLEADIVMHDRDGKFSAAFDQHLKDAGLRITKSAYRSPNTVAYVERFIQSLKQECLDYFFVFGQLHMDYLCTQFVQHYHEERPHQGRDNDLLVTKPKKKRNAVPETISLSSVRCKNRLGGLCTTIARPRKRQPAVFGGVPARRSRFGVRRDVDGCANRLSCRLAARLEQRIYLSPPRQQIVSGVAEVRRQVPIYFLHRATFVVMGVAQDCSTMSGTRAAICSISVPRRSSMVRYHW